MAAMALLALCVADVGARAQTDEDDAPDTDHFRSAFAAGAPRHFIDAVLLGSVPGALAAARALPQGVNTPGGHGHTALEAAVWRDDVTMVRALLDAGAHPDGEPHRAPIGLAFQRGAVDSGTAIADTLVKHGAHIDGDSYGQTAMGLAASTGRLDVVEALAALHADMNRGLGDEQSALLSAAETGHWRVVAWMLNHGGDLWTSDRFGSTLGDTAQRAHDPRIDAAQPAAEREALDRVIATLKKRGFPWPPPSPAHVMNAQARGAWPPGATAGDGVGALASPSSDDHVRHF
nr:ankyrin repeat domain-containing protein [Ameyamaea chiangmaiensis]